MADEKTKNGRPKIPIDWEEAAELAHMQCTSEEIAGWFRTTTKTLSDRCRKDLGEGLGEFIKRNAETGKASLRRAQWINAVHKNNTAMQIWLGKNMLGQSDRQDITTKGESVAPQQVMVFGDKKIVL